MKGKPTWQIPPQMNQQLGSYHIFNSKDKDNLMIHKDVSNQVLTNFQPESTTVTTKNVSKRTP